MSDVPKRPPRTSRPRSSGDCIKDGQPKDLSMSPQPKDRKAVTVHTELPMEKSESEKDNGCVAAIGCHNSQVIVDVDLGPDCTSKSTVGNVVINAGLSCSEQRDTMSSESVGEVSLRHSKKTRRAPSVPEPELVPATKPVDTANVSSGCDVMVSKNLQTCCNEEKQVKQHQECMVELNSTRSSSHLPASLPGVSVSMSECSLPNFKPALKPKPSIRSLRDASPKKEESVINSSRHTSPNREESVVNQLPIVDHLIPAGNPFLSSAEVNVKSSELQDIAVPMPIYAVVDKSRKQSTNAVERDSESRAPKNTEPTRKLEHLLSDESTDVLVHVPPKKPPRTFAHSEYMRIKSATLPPSTSRGFTISCDYEEIESVQQQIAELNKSSVAEASDNDSETDGSGMETANASNVVRKRQTNDKLPAPPRPPPPACLDNKRASMGISHVIMEEDVNDDKKFFRNSSYVRNSERARTNERRKPERSLSMQERRHCDEQKFEGKGKFAKAKEGDDTYATSAESGDFVDRARKENNLDRDSRVADKFIPEDQIDSPRQVRLQSLKPVFCYVTLSKIIKFS